MRKPNNVSNTAREPTGILTFPADATFAANSTGTQVATAVAGVRAGDVVAVSAIKNPLPPGMILHGMCPVDGVVYIALDNTRPTATNFGGSDVQWMTFRP